MKRALLVIAVALVLGVAALIGGVSAKSLVDSGSDQPSATSSPTTAADGAELEPINPAGADSAVESESDRASRQLDMVVIGLVLLALLVTGVTVLIWRRSRPQSTVGPAVGAVSGGTGTAEAARSEDAGRT